MHTELSTAERRELLTEWKTNGFIVLEMITYNFKVKSKEMYRLKCCFVDKNVLRVPIKFQFEIDFSVDAESPIVCICIYSLWLNCYWTLKQKENLWVCVYRKITLCNRILSPIQNLYEITHCFCLSKFDNHHLPRSNATQSFCILHFCLISNHFP